MNVYIVQNENKFGPYSWIEIYVGLKKGEWAYADTIRLEESGEILSIEDSGLWNEGSDVGPFTWEEILFLRNEGYLEGLVQAKIEGEEDYSTLESLIAERPQLTSGFPIPNTRSKRSWLVPASLALAALALIAGLVGAYLGTRLSPDSIRAVEAVAVPTIKNAPADTATGVNPTTAESAPPRSEGEKSPEPVEKAPVAAVPARFPIENQSSPAAQPAPETISPTIPQSIAQVSTPAPSPSPKAALSTDKKEPSSTPAPKLVEVKPTPAPTPAGKIIANFFTIRSIKYHKREPRDGIGVWRFEEAKNKRNVPDEFQECLEVGVTVAENFRSDQSLAVAHFFDADDKLAFTQKTPSKVGKKSDRSHFAMPVLFKGGETERLFFEVPESLRAQKWKAVVVFGDKHEAKSITYPATTSDFRLAYPEKELVEDRTAKRIARKPAMDPLIEHVVKTKNPKQPQITLFLRPPAGVSDASDVKGVMALCVLSPSVEALKRELQKEEMDGDYRGLLGFANKHKLAIVAWGSRGFWDVGRNYDELAKERAKEIDKNFDIVADAWERGVKELCEKFGLPDRNFLIWGQSGSAQWAKRLCLRKPDYFLAIHIHVPSSFDRPTPEARKVLWCVTTGELETGYERSKRFVSDCQKLGYPIVYKAIPGLGHAGHPDTSALGFKFFEFALTQRKLREAFDEQEKSRMTSLIQEQPEQIPPWPDIFQNPAFYADVVNQEMFPAEQKEMIPEGFRISLPNEDIAKIWGKSK